jgi:Zn finger protein HypA/HybF involved in hydrogenase expression
VLDAVQAEAALHGGARVTRAGLRIGELSGVEVESLRFCL